MNMTTMYYNAISILYSNPETSWVDKQNQGINDKIDMKVEEIKVYCVTWIQTFFSVITDSLLSVLAVGVIGYILYHCVLYMFMREEKHFQKVIFGYFGFILVRILNVVINVQLGVL